MCIIALMAAAAVAFENAACLLLCHRRLSALVDKVAPLFLCQDEEIAHVQHCFTTLSGVCDVVYLCSLKQCTVFKHSHDQALLHVMDRAGWDGAWKASMMCSLPLLGLTLLNLQDEREERELRKVEMQTQKAENMIEHEAEIYARPPRTWFQTEKQKKESAKRGRAGADEEGASQAKPNKKQKREDSKGTKEKRSKEDKAKQKHGDALLEVGYQWLTLPD